MNEAERIAKLLGGRPLPGGEFLCRCPVGGHGKGKGDRNPSLLIKQGDKVALFKCFGGCDSKEVLDEVRQRGMLEFSQPVNHVKSDTPRPLKQWAADNHTKIALSIWRECRNPQGTAVHKYLRGRSIELPEDMAARAVGYHADCPFGAGRRVPAMVCLVRDITTNCACAIHRTAIDLDGNKIRVDGVDRLSLGPIAGGAIKLTPDEAVTTCLGIAEGVETALSLRHAPEFGSSPVWSLISASGVAQFPVLPGVDSLWIAVDHDRAGTRAAQNAADRWLAAGRAVFFVKPLATSKDLNDVVVRADA